MNYFFNIVIFLLLFAPALACDICSFELIKKSAYAAIREDFESVLGDLTKFDYILICPGNSQISVVKISEDKITRKYWCLGIPKRQVMVRDFDKKNLFELKKAVDKIFITYEKNSEKPLVNGHLYLYRKAADDFSWRCVRFMPGLKDPEFKILYKILIPDEDIPDPKDVQEFLRDIDNPNKGNGKHG
jgi:hypothetical protein